MKFSGHETFCIRDGWLHKGLQLTESAPDEWANPQVADVLGVGRNMAKSIKHWLVVTGLAEVQQTDSKHRSSTLALTALGSIIQEHDPYFLELDTWWILHLNTIHSKGAGSWHWFFSMFGIDRFERGACVEHLRRHLTATRKRPPSVKTIERDISCMLAMYSNSIPPATGDPEDALSSPFTELGLMTHFKGSGYFQVNYGRKTINPNTFGYALSLSFNDTMSSTEIASVPLYTVGRHPLGPGRAFAMTDEQIYEQIQSYEQESADCAISIGGLVGERTIRYTVQDPLDYANAFFSTLEPTEIIAA